MKNVFHPLLSALILSVVSIGFLHAASGEPYQRLERKPLFSDDPCEPVRLQCDTEDTCDLFGRPECRRKGPSIFKDIEITGWIQAGVYTNSRGNTTTRTKGPNDKGREVSSPDFGSGNSALLSTLHSSDVQVNQIWLIAKKEANGKKGFDWGFAAEVFFGPEAWFSQSWGDAKFDYGWQDGDYYSAIPQLYFQLAYGDLSLKIGKYETMVGFESLRAPDFFFYSHAHMFMMEPYSHSGFLFEYTPNDKLHLAAGYTTGGDSSFENAYDDHGFLGYVSYQFTPKLKLSYAVHAVLYGNRAFYPSGTERDFHGENSFFHTLAVSYDMTKKLNYSVQWNYGDAKSRFEKTHRTMYGLGHYLTYQMSNHWGLGFRFDWAHDHTGTYVGYYKGDAYGYTLCMNWKPYEFLSIRPELRYDYCKEAPFNNGRNRDQFSGGIGAVCQF